MAGGWRSAARWSGRIALALGAAVLLAVLALAALPVGLFKPLLQRKLMAELDAPVSIGSIERDGWFSFAPLISVRRVSIGQPAWAGAGNMLRVERAQLRLPIVPAVMGRGIAIDTLTVSGLQANLVRDRNGRSNWSRGRSQPDREPRRASLRNLVIEGGRFTLRDAKRELSLAGAIASHPRDGVKLDAAGSFRGSPARLIARGARVAGIDPSAPWPFQARLTSPILDLAARGTMQGPLNASAMTLAITARGSDLKHLDTIIEAGLFGTQPINLSATVRHAGTDWFVDRLAGSIGRSQITGAAKVLKRDGRTKIDAAIHASRFDFDSLADQRGLAAAAALRARIGARVIPDTRINLSKMGPTDGVIRFRADRLLFRDNSIFRSLAGTITLDHSDLRITDIVAAMADGRMTGAVRVDSRAAVPILSSDLRFEGATLQGLIGAPGQIAGPAQGRVRLTGRGDTIRSALTNADGKAALVSTGGSISRLIAYVLGQDLGGAIGQAIGGGEKTASLRCLIADFRAKNGVLTPAALVVDTGVSVGEGKGRIVMDGERIELAMTGRTRGRGVLRLTDPIRIGGTLSKPAISVADLAPGEKPKSAGVLKALGRSIGSALGLRKDAPPAPRGPAQGVDCRALAAAALR